MVFLVIKRKKLYLVAMAFLLALVGIFCALYFRHVPAASRPTGYLALIIDDFGNNSRGTDEILALNIPLTVAVMPFLSCTEKDATAAHNAGKEVILHVPMEPVSANSQWLGPLGITTDLSDKEIQRRVESGLKEVKWAVGMNNHMGSKAMRERGIVRVLMKVARKHNLYFVDSRTTPLTVAEHVAYDYQVPFFRRHVFLDNSPDQASIEKELKKAGDLALHQGYAVAIGHVGGSKGINTAHAIATLAPRLKAEGVRFVFVSQLKGVTYSGPTDLPQSQPAVDNKPAVTQ